jgi:hypothetical protein
MKVGILVNIMKEKKKLKLKYLRWMKYFFGNKFQNKTSFIKFLWRKIFLDDKMNKEEI